MTNPEELNEAPASVTLSVITPAGYNALFTIRDTQVSELIKKIEFVEGSFEKLGYKPQPARTFGQKKEIEYVEGRVCPEDGGRLIKKTTKTGKIAIECENRKYDYTTKQSTGCQFIEWI